VLLAGVENVFLVKSATENSKQCGSPLGLANKQMLPLRRTLHSTNLTFFALYHNREGASSSTRRFVNLHEPASVNGNNRRGPPPMNNRASSHDVNMRIPKSDSL
jgi:hypothetical protein